MTTSAMPLKRPFAVAALAVVYVCAGVSGIVYHARELNIRQPFAEYALPVLLVRVLAIVIGIALWRGANWARWLAVFWMALHVVISAFGDWGGAVMHALLCAAITYLLFQRSMTPYFQPRQVT